MRRITYLQKLRSFVLYIQILNDTQTRRLFRKCDSSREIGITERASEGGQLTQLQHCPSHKGVVAGNQDEAVNVGDGGKKQKKSRKKREKKRKRKCVNILCIAEHSITNFNGDGVSTHKLKNVV
jgi:hypothetical protein